MTTDLTSKSYSTYSIFLHCTPYTWVTAKYWKRFSVPIGV